ncbi:glycosyltransferase [candidate division KSB3 bacterium]|uniref:Glycosyltransferase n=1 Tax=candidate division KSB3 bacterium TaxID=2044937 RepID=A0A9D5JU88_9BACT|nr:glycosyltransferase [candidate division KSB3 bacterium]MBD3324348.1 glycosyltransferase [candidate division KSB3 bacterium]
METRQPLSVTLIAFNEEKRIRAALESVKWADEIVVIDSGSTDRTVEICRAYTPHVHQMAWHGYVDQKNLATANTSHDWVLNIDADERVSDALAQKLRQILAQTPQYAGYFMPRKTYYLGAWIRYCGWYPDYKLRLFDKRLGQWVGQALHEKVQVEGPTAYLQHDLYHDTYEDIADHLRAMNSYTTIAASQKTTAISGAGILFRTGGTFLKKYLLQQGFRDGTRGVIVSLLAACTVAAKYAKLWERQHVESERPTQHDL